MKDCEHLRHKDFSYNKTRKIREKRKEKLWVFWIEKLVCVLREGVSTASERLCFSHLDEMNENYMTSESQVKVKSI